MQRNFAGTGRSTASQGFTARPRAVSAQGDGAVQKRLMKALIAATGSAPAQFEDLRLYYIRGIAEHTANGELVRTVLYTPEFLYTADVGTPRRAGFLVPYELPDVPPNTIVLGDPDFPNFDAIELMSVASADPSDLLYPAVAGTLIVSFRSDTDLATARSRLSGYLDDVEVLSPAGNVFIGRGGFFDETGHGQRIETEVDDVKYASLDSVVRIIDFVPGWFVDPVI